MKKIYYGLVTTVLTLTILTGCSSPADNSAGSTADTVTTAEVETTAEETTIEETTTQEETTAEETTAEEVIDKFDGELTLNEVGKMTISMPAEFEVVDQSQQYMGVDINMFLFSSTDGLELVMASYADMGEKPADDYSNEVNLENNINNMHQNVLKQDANAEVLSESEITTVDFSGQTWLHKNISIKGDWIRGVGNSDKTTANIDCFLADRYDGVQMVIMALNLNGDNSSMIERLDSLVVVNEE